MFYFAPDIPIPVTSLIYSSNNCQKYVFKYSYKNSYYIKNKIEVSSITLA